MESKHNTAEPSATASEGKDRLNAVLEAVKRESERLFAVDRTLDLADVRDLIAPITTALDERDRQLAEAKDLNLKLRRHIAEDDHAIEQALGKALGYPEIYTNETGVVTHDTPGATTTGEVCVAPHTAVSLALEAAKVIGRLKAERDEIRKRCDVLDSALAQMSASADGILANFKLDGSLAGNGEWRAKELFKRANEINDAFGRCIGQLNIITEDGNPETVCKGCGKPLEKANAWMDDGCPCNTPAGANAGNQLISEWRRELQQEASHALATTKQALEAAEQRAHGIATNEMNRLAAISTAAMSDTPISALANRIGKDHPFWTAAYEDVCHAVLRLMRQREAKESAERERDELRKKLEANELKATAFFKQVTDKLLMDGLVALAGAVCTPERGYIEDGGCEQFLADIRTLRKEHDYLRARLATAAEVKRGPCELGEGEWAVFTWWLSRFDGKFKWKHVGYYPRTWPKEILETQIAIRLPANEGE